MRPPESTMTEAETERWQEWIGSLSKDRRRIHGSMYGYQVMGCRCSACHNWQRAYGRQVRARKKADRT